MQSPMIYQIKIFCMCSINIILLNSPFFDINVKKRLLISWGKIKIIKGVFSSWRILMMRGAVGFSSPEPCVCHSCLGPDWQSWRNGCLRLIMAKELGDTTPRGLGIKSQSQRLSEDRREEKWSLHVFISNDFWFVRQKEYFVCCECTFKKRGRD